jgi:hypothetical protein
MPLMSSGVEDAAGLYSIEKGREYLVITDRC